MQHTRFSLRAQDVAAINTLAAFLALDDIGSGGRTDPFDQIAGTPVDCVILAGNAVLHTAESAFRLVKNGACPRLLLSGGIGHSSALLWQQVARHERYRSIPAEGRAEAAIFADMAETVWGIERSRLIVEAASTNTGENAAFSRKALEEAGQRADVVLLIQDPTMQRRTDATFRHVWRDLVGVTFLNWPTFTPRLTLDEGEPRFENRGIAGLWSMDRFLALALGEVPRLRNDPSGYGPKGKGFIAEVAVPDAIERAHRHLTSCLGLQVRHLGS
jgi:uncharacterized SAM-binding protein YcdF (DUF218 family)